jgi:hypothetical protein
MPPAARAVGAAERPEIGEEQGSQVLDAESRFVSGTSLLGGHWMVVAGLDLELSSIASAATA